MPKPYNGILIAIEGIDGSGKTTQANLLEQRLNAVGLDSVYTKEPTEGEWGMMIRGSKVSGRLDPVEEYNAFIMDRKQHVERELKPWLDECRIVIVDRYYFSSMAYQVTEDRSPEQIRTENEEFAPVPDLLVILELDVDESLRRIRERDERPDTFETRENLEQCARIFGQVEGDFVLRIDARQTIDEIAETIAKRLYEGPLFDAFCKKQYLEQCEPAFCVFREECPYPTLGANLPGA